MTADESMISRGRSAGQAIRSVRCRLRKFGPWHATALAAVLALASFLHFYRLGHEGYGNLYYAAAVKSMLSSWHNFFFVSFDSGGFVSVDKPPVGLWVQAASASLFGFSGISLLAPQALAGVISVGLLYYLVKRAFGPTAGLIAALVLAVTPITVAAGRNNTMDSLLVLTSLLAAWAAIIAAESGRLRWLVLCAALVGLGFNIKMLQATLVLPALFLLYLAAAPLDWRKRLLHLGAATTVLVAVSLSWAVAVDLTPADERPYVGSSTNNTVIELITGHNGIRRLGPLAGLIGVDSGGPRPNDRPPAGPPQGVRLPPGPTAPGQGPPAGGPGPQFPPQAPAAPGGSPPLAGGGPAPGPTSETGRPGVLRLFNKELAGQVTWLLPLAGLGLLAAATREKPLLPLSRKGRALLFWSAWLAPQVIFFSFAGLFHRYYLEMLSPAVAAIVAAGIAAMWTDYRQGGLRACALPAALVLAAATEVYILSGFPEWSNRLTPVVLGATLSAALVLAGFTLARRAAGNWPRIAAAVGVLGLLIAPAVWAAIPVWNGGDTGLPYAGPRQAGRPAGKAADVSQLVAYLTENDDGEDYILATLNANTAAPVILETSEAVMAMGGFSGSDPILTADELATAVETGKVRFFLVPSAGNAPPGAPQPPNQQGGLTRWVTENCSLVDAELWQPQANNGAPIGAGPGGPQQLFDCRNVATTQR